MFAMKKANCVHQKITAKIVQNANATQATSCSLRIAQAARRRRHSAHVDEKKRLRQAECSGRTQTLLR
jgi:hypothetical protein